MSRCVFCQANRPAHGNFITLGGGLENQTAAAGNLLPPKKLAAISFPIHFSGVHLAHLRLRDFRMLAPETIYGNFKA